MGTLLNQIFIQRTASDGTVTSVTRIPIAYGPKDKTINRYLTDPDLSRPFGSILPFISFELVRVAKRTDDQLSKVLRFVGTTSNKDMASWAHNPIPYDFEFQVHIMVRSVYDGWKIVEQILPWFSPDWTITVKLMNEPQIALDIQTLLDPVDMADSYSEGEYGDTRYVSWTLNFKMKGYLFGPPSKSKIIKSVETHLAVDANNTLATVTVTPGLTANGEPTSNAANSVPASEIDWTDDYGFITEVTDG
jgi:hypothetical protein